MVRKEDQLSENHGQYAPQHQRNVVEILAPGVLVEQQLHEAYGARQRDQQAHIDAGHRVITDGNFCAYQGEIGIGIGWDGGGSEYGIRCVL